MTTNMPGTAPALPMTFSETVVLAGTSGGIAFIPAATPLIALNYYDGRFLKADDLNLERRGIRAYADFSNRAGGPGVVHGFDVSLVAGGRLRLTDGLAVDPGGRLLFLPEAVDVEVADLVAAASKNPTEAVKPAQAGPSFAPCEVSTATGTAPTVAGGQLYLICLAHAEGLCGNAEVFGRLCADACITATDRPYLLDGVVVLLAPITLQLLTSQAVTLGLLHRRSMVASAYFAQEWAAGGSLLSAAGLKSPIWCRGAPATLGQVLPVGVLDWRGTAAGFVDEWTARRERMEAPSRRYWAGRMEMRPWPAFMAQVLQFQCQLTEVLDGVPVDDPEQPDDCEEAHSLLQELTYLSESIGGPVGSDNPKDVPFQLSELQNLSKKAKVLLAAAGSPKPARILIDRGIVELPAAGYLPVALGSTLTIRQQMQRLMGAGVDLRVCAVRRDQIAHELERAQHMNRISLLTGLDDPKARQNVDILVPDGQVAHGHVTGVGLALEGAVGFASQDRMETLVGNAFRAAAGDPHRLPFEGAGRVDWRGGAVEVRAAVAATADQGIRTFLPNLTAAFRTKSSAAAVAKIAKARFGRSGLDVDKVVEVSRTATLLRRRGLDTVTSDAAATADDKGDVIGAHASLRLEIDPFDLKTGESTEFVGSVSAALPNARAGAGFFREVEGELTVVEVNPDAQGTSLVVSANGTIGVPGQTPKNLKDVRFRMRKVVAGKALITVQPFDKPEWTVTFSWFATPAVAGTAYVDVAQDMQKRRLADMSADEDADIGDPANEYHKAAVGALDAIGLARKDSQWAVAEGAKLFPKADPGTVDIRPSTDWVLFRRRRFEECDDRKPPAPPSPPSKVTAWVQKSGSGEEAEKIAELVLKERAEGLEWQQVDVEFQAASKLLKTPAAVVRQRYEETGGGELVQLAGYAPNGPTGLTLLKPRTEELLDALQGVADVGPGGQVAEVAQPPADLMLPGTDASIFLVTYTESASGCVDVFAVDMTPAANQLRTILSKGDPPALEKVNDRTQVLYPLGSVSFDGSHVPDSGEVAGVLSKLNSVRSELANKYDSPMRAEEGYGWRAADHPDAAAAATDLSELFPAMKIDQQGSAIDAEFPHEDGCLARAYVVVERVAPQ